MEFQQGVRRVGTIAEEADAIYVGITDALTTEERTEQIAATQAAILEAERVEELMVEREGGVRRRNADPRAVLGLSADCPAP